MTNDELWCVAKKLSRQSPKYKKFLLSFNIYSQIYRSIQYKSNCVRLYEHFGEAFFRRVVKKCSQFENSEQYLENVFPIKQNSCRAPDDIYHDLYILSQDDTIHISGAIYNLEYSFEIQIICPNVVYDDVDFGDVVVTVSNIFDTKLRYTCSINGYVKWSSILIEASSQNELCVMDAIYQTPHCKNNDLCVGSWCHTLDALFHLGYFIEAIELLERIIYTYTPEDTFIDIEAWKYGVCDQCGKILDDMGYCEYCDIYSE